MIIEFQEKKVPYQKVKAKFDKGIKHIVVFYCYPGENRHVKEHTIFNEKMKEENYCDLVFPKDVGYATQTRIFFFEYSISKVNEVYKETYKFEPKKVSPKKSEKQDHEINL
jgi:hypothetical protein